MMSTRYSMQFGVSFLRALYVIRSAPGAPFGFNLSNISWISVGFVSSGFVILFWKRV